MKILLPLIVSILSLPTVIYAQDSVYSPLVDLSNAGQGTKVQTFEEYINFLYGFSIALAALLAVIKIVIAGAKYMLDDVITGKEQAKKDIQGAILGLLLILSAVIILELINPQLIKREIKFNDFQSKRPDLSVAVATTVGGQTVEQLADSLSKGLDACVYKTEPGTSASGKVTIVVANANPCGDKARDQLQLFAQNCIDGGGTPTASGSGTGMVICATPLTPPGGISPTSLSAAQKELDYIKNTFGYSADIDGDGSRTTYTLTSEYIKLEGTTIIVESKRFCEATFTAASMASLAPLQRREVLDGCIAHNWGASRCGFINNGNNRDAVTNPGGFKCAMPKQIIAADTFKVSDSLGTRPPKDYAEMEQLCGSSNDLIKTRGPNFQTTDFSVDPKDYDCFRY